jgi:ATP-dependent helicase HepA
VDLSPISVLVELETGHAVVPGGAGRLEDEIEDVQDAKVGPAPVPLLEAARAAAEREAGEILARRKAEAQELLALHADAEEERLVDAAFQGGAPRARIEGALALVRQHREVVSRSIERVKVELDAAAVVVP